MRKDVLASGILAISALVGGVACGGIESNPVAAPASSSSHPLNIDGFEIEKIGTNVFIVSGNGAGGISYISSRCRVLAVGAWGLGGVYGNYIDKVAVTVDNGDCLPELKK